MAAESGTITMNDKSGHTIVQASFDGEDVSQNKGIIYLYPSEGTSMQKAGISTEADPENLIPGQVPSTPVEVVETEQVEESLEIRFTE